MGRLVKISNSLDQGGQGLDSELSNIVYQLQFRPQQIKLDMASKEADMLQRLDKLENMFGAVPDKMVGYKKRLFNLFQKPNFLLYLESFMCRNWAKMY